jgi:hypothetical protein
MRGKPQRTAAAEGAHGGDSLLQTTEVEISHPLQVVCLWDSEETMGLKGQPCGAFPTRGGNMLGSKPATEQKLSRNQYVSILGKCQSMAMGGTWSTVTPRSDVTVTANLRPPPRRRDAPARRQLVDAGARQGQEQDTQWIQGVW